MMTKKTILLVEDNPSDADLTRRALSKGHISNDLVVAEDGQDALDYLRGEGAYFGRAVSETPSVILLDLKLPKSIGPGCLAGGPGGCPPTANTSSHTDFIERGGGREHGIRHGREQRMSGSPSISRSFKRPSQISVCTG
jgi:CheY-like chemotaxis protein